MSDTTFTTSTDNNNNNNNEYDFVNNKFQWSDYVVFFIMLAASSVIGLYYGCTGSKQKTTSEFLMAGRSMGVLPVSLSMLASFMSAITMLGTPAEMVLYGTQYWVIAFGYALVIPVSTYVFITLFYRLQLTSVFEYLERRFSKGVRVYACIVYVIQTTIYMSMVLFAPCVALSTVTGLNKWIAVCAVGVVCTFYTTIGGMKAVIWTDVVQIGLMFAGLIAVVVKGSIDHGGFTSIWNAMYESDRVKFFDFNPDPTIRHSVWSLTFGAMFTWVAIYGVNQSQVQRALCTSTLRQAQMAMWINLPGLVLILTISCLCGMVIFTEYRCCDPLNKSVGRITGKDQYLPLYIMDHLYYPGFPGFFTACLFSGSLSTLSSGLNSLSAVILQDLVRGLWYRDKELSESKATLISKVISVVFGVIMTALTLVADKLAGLLEAALSLFGMIGGPILGLFTLGIVYPWTNTKGAYVGTTVGLVLTLWLGIGAQVYSPPVKGEIPPKLVTTHCKLKEIGPLANFTTSSAMTSALYFTTESGFTPADDVIANPPCMLQYNSTTVPKKMAPGYTPFYQVSYMWYSTFAVLVTTASGLLVSFLTGYTRPSDLEPELVCPVFNVLKCCLPESWMNVLRCYIDHDKDSTSTDESLAATSKSTMTISNGSSLQSVVGEKKVDFETKIDHSATNF